MRRRSGSTGASSPSYREIIMWQTRCRRPALAVGVLVVFLVTAAPGRADLMLVPAGLHPGDQFRAVFVSSATRDATSADIADYDQFIAHLAAAAGIDTYVGAPVTWRALASTPTVAAVDRLPKVFGSPPLYRLDGSLVAPSAGALWVGGPGSFPISVTESGVDLGGEVIVWTGTLQDGTAFNPLGGGFFVTFGSANHISDSGWVSQNIAPRIDPQHLYGYSSVLTVPPAAAAVPAPAGLTLLLAGIGSLAGPALVRRRFQPVGCDPDLG